MNKDALAARLRATFLGELEDQVGALNDDLLALESAPRDGERLRSVFRIVHTLKGAAHAAGVSLVEKVCHELEADLVEVRDGKVVLHEADFTILFTAADALADAGRRLRAGQDLGSSPLADLAASLTRGERVGQRRHAVSQHKAKAEAQAVGNGSTASALDATLSASSPSAPAPSPASTSAPQRSVRVAATWLDRLVAATGELAVMGSRFSGRPADAEALRTLAASWTADWRRTRVMLRRALERAELPEAARSLGWIDENLRRLSSEAERLAARLADDTRVLTHVTDRLSDHVRHIRLRPFTDACEALPRVARDVALGLGKEVSLTIDGGDVRADREVLDALRDALLHLVRNAVDHGIEPPAERVRLGKPRAGAVHIAAVVRGDRLIVTVSDDGRGIDVGAIEARLRERGVVEMPTATDIGRLLLTGGFSTRREAGMISGRGVGLDAARNAIERVRGSLEVEWTAGRGTTFTLSSPPSLATVRALLVTVNGRMLALPCTDVERVSRIRIDAVKRAAGREVMLTGTDDDGDAVTLASLADIIGVPAAEPMDSTHFTVVTLIAGSGRRLGVIVDRAVEEREIILRPLRTGQQTFPFVSGAAPLGTGQVVLLLDAPAIVATGLDRDGGAAPVVSRTTERTRYRLLVVDDSLTTRTLEQSVLEAAGYDVTTAVDGAQAWDLLQARPYDLVVSDVEMPRMDGFALCQAIRGARRYERLPVILVTGLDAPEHRARGLDVGADAYLTKSSFDQQALLNTIRQLLG